jgi:hypothetical protein
MTSQTRLRESSKREAATWAVTTPLQMSTIVPLIWLRALISLITCQPSEGSAIVKL